MSLLRLLTGTRGMVAAWLNIHPDVSGGNSGKPHTSLTLSQDPFHHRDSSFHPVALTDIFTPPSPCCCIMSFCECLEGECPQQVFSTELGHSPGCPRPAHGSTAKTRQALFWLCLLLPITGSSPRRQYLHQSNGAHSVRCLSSW